MDFKEEKIEIVVTVPRAIEKSKDTLAVIFAFEALDIATTSEALEVATISVNVASSIAKTDVPTYRIDARMGA